MTPRPLSQKRDWYCPECHLPSLVPKRLFKWTDNQSINYVSDHCETGISFVYFKYLYLFYMSLNIVIPHYV